MNPTDPPPATGRSEEPVNWQEFKARLPLGEAAESNAAV